ncbi:MAG: DoxX family protein [Burkholderiaceae bacterium]|nr:DoxX family protein [Burkholderiaceae bacterium]
MNQPHSASIGSRLWTLGETVVRGLNALQPAAQLAARWFIAGVFFRSGLTKIADWETTVALFTDEYHVPLLSPEIAAALGTSAELALPVLILFGFAGRFAAAGLFILNIVAVISVEDMPIPALQQHIFWGSVLIGLLLWGPGRWSVDRFIWPWLRERVVGVSSPASASEADRTSPRRI